MPFQTQVIILPDAVLSENKVSAEILLLLKKKQENNV